MNSTTVRTENDTEEIQTEEIHKQNSSESYSNVMSQFVWDEESLEPRINNKIEQDTGNLSRLVQTLLVALRFYADGGHDSGQKARKAIKLYRGLKYVS